MTRWHSLEPADAGTFTSAPHIYRYQKRFAAPPNRVWESLTSDAAQAAWGPSVKEITWLSPRPFGVGTTREVVLAGGITRVRERFFRFDEGQRYSFEVYEASAPLLRRFAENYELEPDGDGTLFTWTVAIEAKRAVSLPFKLVSPGVKAAFGRMAADGQRYFAGQT